MVPPEVTEQVNQFPAWAGGVLFWLGMALILGYAAYIYFSGKGANFGWLSKLWAMLRQRWLQWRSAYRTWAATRLPTLQKAAGDVAEGRRPLSQWRVGSLDPTQQARYYYLSMVERAEQSGIPRRTSETPLQYAPRLAQQLEEKLEDKAAVQEVTEAFLQARYTRRPIGADQATKLQTLWQQIRQHLNL